MRKALISGVIVGLILFIAPYKCTDWQYWVSLFLMWGMILNCASK